MARVQTVGAQHAGPVFQSHCILRASIKAQLKTEQPIIMSMITYASHQETSINNRASVLSGESRAIGR